MTRLRTIPAILHDDIDLAEGESERLAAIIRTPMNFTVKTSRMVEASASATHKLRECGATIARKGERTTIHFRELQVSSDMGLYGALRAWAAEARNHLSEQGESQ